MAITIARLSVLTLMLLPTLGFLAGCAPTGSVVDPGMDDPDVPGAVDEPDGDDSPALSDQALPDFSLPDVNANSARHRELISPRDYLGQVSAWYFGHST